ncbi:MAG: DNA-directed DNA polymerase II small subunit [Candidatus Bathyarchaeia archaeon]
MSYPDGLRRALSRALMAGLQIDAKAMEALRGLGPADAESAIDALISEARASGDFVIRLEAVQRILSSRGTAGPRAEGAPTGKAILPHPAKDYGSDIRVLRGSDAAQPQGGGPEDFSSLFRSRFEALSKILRRRVDVRDAEGIAEALEARKGDPVKFIAMIYEKAERERGLVVSVEDPEASAAVLIPKDRRELFDLAMAIPLDQVVCISGKRGAGDLFIAEEILLPDVPDRRIEPPGIPLSAVLLSDLHVGSRTFMEGPFKRFLAWLKGDLGGGDLRALARAVKYVIIAGDIVDGVGVYPDHERDLAIPDLYKQYERAAELLSGIPDYVELIAIPGNHDPVRQALPQPPIPRDYAEPLLEARPVMSLGNPAELSIHGLSFLIYHGRSLDDLMASAPGPEGRRPEAGMELLLRCRHLSPQYGSKTPIAPIREDALVIGEPPDVFQAGHVHVFGLRSYRGTRLVNCGAWQSQTDYQRRMGLEPTPCIAPILSFADLNIQRIDFSSEALELV